MGRRSLSWEQEDVEWQPQLPEDQMEQKCKWRSQSQKCNQTYLRAILVPMQPEKKVNTDLTPQLMPAEVSSSECFWQGNRDGSRVESFVQKYLGLGTGTSKCSR